MRQRQLRMVGWIVLLCGLMLAQACAPSMSPAVGAQAVAAAAVVEENYQLGPGDEIEIAVWKEEELSKRMVIRPDGKISYPLIGEVQAAGKTVKQLREEISKSLEKFVTDAQVTVMLIQPQNYKIYVTGQVNSPGEFSLTRPANVMQALSMAGGLTPFAKSRNIVVLRHSGGMEQTFRFDYMAVSRGQYLEQNLTLLPGDVVVVP
jgi:polysaccharide biosynthesis/export protein